MAGKSHAQTETQFDLAKHTQQNQWVSEGVRGGGKPPHLLLIIKGYLCGD